MGAVLEEVGDERVVSRNDEGADVGAGARIRVVRTRCGESAPSEKPPSREQMRFGVQDLLCCWTRRPSDGADALCSSPAGPCWSAGSNGPLGLRETGVGHAGDAVGEKTGKAGRFLLLLRQVPAVVQQLWGRGRLSASIHHRTRRYLVDELLRGSYQLPSLAKKLYVSAIQLDRTQRLTEWEAPSLAPAMCVAAARPAGASLENQAWPVQLRTRLKQSWSSSSSCWCIDKCLGGRP